MRFLKILATLLLLAATCFAARAVEEKDTVILNFDGADIRSVIKTVGMITGKNFILDPRVTGTINIISANPVQRDLVYPILLSALRMQGFTAIEGSNGVVKVLPEADAKLTYSPTGAKSRAGGDRIITQVYTLKYESAVQLVPVLRPLIAPNNVINAYPNSNTLVITDYAENLRRIDKIISSIDIASSAEIELIKLEHASAQDISQLLARLMPEASAPAAVPGGLPKLVFAVDSRTNGLIVRADSMATIAKVKQLVAGMDIPSAEGGNIRVIYLRNAEAAKVAETLRGILGGAGGGGGVSSPQPVQAQPGQPGQPTAAGPVPTISIPASSGGGSIQAHPSTNSLVITAPDYVYNSIRSVIEKLDARRAQVFIEALIVEVSTDQAAEFGIQWQDLSGAADNNLTAVGGTNFNTAGAGNNIIRTAGNLANVGAGLNIGIVKGRISIPGIGEVLNLGMLARALESRTNTNILSTPNLLTVDNEEAKIVVGQNVPFVTGSFSQTQGGVGAGVNPFQTIERRDVGLTLRVTPQVAEGGTVKLKIFQEVSSLSRSAGVSTADVVTNKRSIESTVLVDDQQTVVLGGLIQDDVQNQRDQVPGLGSIPIIGNLFRYETRQRKKTNLMVFLRPVILRDNLSPGPITNERYDYIRNEQAKAKVPDHWLLPDMESPQLPERDPLFGPRLSALIKPDDANAQQAPNVADPSPLSMSRRIGGEREQAMQAPAAPAGAAASQPRELLPGGVQTTGGFSDNLMLAPPAAAKRSTKAKR
jgi:general secretion pathway protein D